MGKSIWDRVIVKWESKLNLFPKTHRLHFFSIQDFKMSMVVTNVYKDYKTKELMRRLLLMTVSSNTTIANNAGEVLGIWYIVIDNKFLAHHWFQIFQYSLKLLGPSVFSKIFKPWVYDIFIGGNEEKVSILIIEVHQLPTMQYTMKFYRIKPLCNDIMLGPSFGPLHYSFHPFI